MKDNIASIKVRFKRTMAEIIKHNEAEELADLPEHPIPALEGLDLMSILESGGAELVVVIADPIDESEFSQQRLIHKLANYFTFINSEQYARQVGVAPNIENTKVVVKIHPDSSGVYSELITNCISWAKENNSAIELKVLTNKEMGIE